MLGMAKLVESETPRRGLLLRQKFCIVVINVDATLTALHFFLPFLRETKNAALFFKSFQSKTQLKCFLKPLLPFLSWRRERDSLLCIANLDRYKVKVCISGPCISVHQIVNYSYPPLSAVVRASFTFPIHIKKMIAVLFICF